MRKWSVSDSHEDVYICAVQNMEEDAKTGRVHCQRQPRCRRQWAQRAVHPLAGAPGLGGPGQRGFLFYHLF